MLTSVTFASAACFLVIKYSNQAGGDGLAETKTILGGFGIQNFLGLGVGFVKAIALPLAVGSGLLLGKESCLVHLAGCIANSLFEYFPKYKGNQSQQREIISCTSAAGIAVAFGAPIGGVLLSLEGLSTYFPAKTMVRSFFCALLASVTVQLIDPYRGKRVRYQVFYTHNWLFFEILFFGIVGIIGGILGSFFLGGYRYARKWNDSVSPVYHIAILSASTAFISYFNIFTRIDGSELLESLFRQCSPNEHLGLCESEVKWGLIALLLEAFVLKTVLPVHMKSLSLADCLDL